MTEYMMNSMLLTAYAEEPATDLANTNASAGSGENNTANDENTQQQSGGGVSTIIIMVAMVAVFYFLLIRPQRKKDKAVKNMLDALKVGDRICTIGGIYGTITNMKNDTVTLSIGGQQNPVVIARWAIRSVEDAAVENDADIESK